MEEERDGDVLMRVRESDGVEVIRVRVAQNMGFGVTEISALRASQVLPHNSGAT